MEPNPRIRITSFAWHSDARIARDSRRARRNPALHRRREAKICNSFQCLVVPPVVPLRWIHTLAEIGARWTEC